MRILYLGVKSGTALDRAEALRRLGHEVEHVDLRALLPQSIWIDRIAWRLGGQWFTSLLRNALERTLGPRNFELCHVDGGEWVTARIIALLRQHAPLVVNYCIDDPLGGRDGARWDAYLQTISAYDLCVVVRAPNVHEARRAGAREVIRVTMTADEVTHAPRAVRAEDVSTWRADVLFMGSWFPERGPFLLALMKRGVPLSIRGSGWDRAPEWPELKRVWRGGYLKGDNYARAIQCAAVNLGLLSKGNRDEHTTRSLEIPALGGLLCAERTAEHRNMYLEGEEALFWKDAHECAEVCLAALSDPARRRRIAAAGRARILRNGHFNQVVMNRIVSAARSLGNAA